MHLDEPYFFSRVTDEGGKGALLNTQRQALQRQREKSQTRVIEGRTSWSSNRLSHLDCFRNKIVPENTLGMQVLATVTCCEV